MTKSNRVSPDPKLENLDKLAWYLDSSIRIPGTKWTIGLDGLLGLIPGIGDLISGLISSYIVLKGAKRGLPAIVIVNMLLNLGLDTIIGAIPIIGDIFDLAFKANNRNVKLIHSYEKDPNKIKKQSLFSIAIFSLIVILSLASIFWVTINLLSSLSKLLF
jgi:hypothetical protein